MFIRSFREFYELSIYKIIFSKSYKLLNFIDTHCNKKFATIVYSYNSSLI